MRPSVLNPLFRPLETLPGLGKKLTPLYEKLTGGQGYVVDALWHLPSNFVRRTYKDTLSEVDNGCVITLRVTIEEHVSPPRKSRAPWRVYCRTQSGSLTLTWFRAHHDWLKKNFPIGEERLVSGKIDFYNGEPCMVHPDYFANPSQARDIPQTEPIYPLSAGITNRTATKMAQAALNLVPDVPEWVPSARRDLGMWPSWKEALTSVHAPKTEDDLLGAAPARQRLAYDELLANQLALILVRRAAHQTPGRSLCGNGYLRTQVQTTLPFALTQAQQRTLHEIESDMQAPHRMLRLLQGDVGSGKTIVALLAMLNAVECGAQAALMAPTEILARQHYESLRHFLDTTPVKIDLLTGRDKGKSRQKILDDLKCGKTSIIIGTHALFQRDVAFHNLGLAVIDEQHRFGVRQRLSLSEKGSATDILVMTATPIPRTLTLTRYGDMDVSKLDSKPPGRQPIDTRIVSRHRLPQVIEGLQRILESGAKVYWICPLVEDSDTSDIIAAEERHQSLYHIFGNRVGLIHGRMKGPEKDTVMQGFAQDLHDILVATTVIEVGVDVPKATLIIIEQAERFGLAQLHQLRGRVGRGDKPSVCLLLYDSPLSENARMRLETMRATEDGFFIAEEDLRLRGGGEILGTRQSGIPECRVAHLHVHGDLLFQARNDAHRILADNPQLTGTQGDALRTLLYLFERDSAAQTLHSG